MIQLRKSVKRVIVAICICTLLLANMDSTTNMRFVKAESQESLYVLDKFGCLESYMGNASEIELPLEVNGVQVQGISNKFSESNMKNVKKVIIPAGFPRIDAYAFDDCSKLEEVKVEQPVEYIGGKAFRGCSSLKQIQIQCERVSGNVFENCTSLTKATFIGTKKMGTEVFKGCISLREVNIPENVDYIDCFSFTGCKSLKINVYGLETGFSNEAFMPSTVTVVCYKGAKVEKQCKENGINVSYLEDTVTPQPTLTQEPASLTQDGFTVTKEGTLISYTGGSLDNIAIPDEICGVTVKIIGTHAFQGTNIKNITIPEGVKKISDRAFSYCNFLEKIVIPRNVEEIGEAGFACCSTLKSVTIENGIAEIPIDCFQTCGNLETVVLPESVMLINPGAFQYCYSLKKVMIPNANTFISATSFSKGIDTVFTCKKASNVDAIIGGLGFQRNYLTDDATIIPSIMPTVIEETKEPVQTEIPVETEITETEKPNKTETPETSKPVETEIIETEGPDRTEAPETSKPVETEVPEIGEPDRTEVPETNKPVETEIPKTEEPIVTEIPVTTEPAIKPTQTPTATIVPSKEPVKNDVVLKTKTIKIGKGEKISFPLNNKTGKTIKYKVKDKKILSVSKKGVIKGIRVGKTKVYATLSGKKFVLNVSVKKMPVTIKISSVSKVKMSIGGKLILQASMNSGAASYKLKWYSSNKKVVTVNNLGVATIKGKGKATIKVKTYNGVMGTLRLRIK